MNAQEVTTPTVDPTKSQQLDANDSSPKSESTGKSSKPKKVSSYLGKEDEIYHADQEAEDYNALSTEEDSDAVETGIKLADKAYSDKFTGNMGKKEKVILSSVK